VIPEGVVLLAVQHLQQGGGGVAPHIAAQLVDLVQHQQGIHGAAAGDGVDDAARHGADVGLAVAPNVRLVPDAAQTQTGHLPVQGLGYRQGDGGLAHAGRAHQTENFPLGVGAQLPHRHELQNTLLHLLQTEVIPVKDAPGLRHVRPVTGILAPRQLQTHVQIVADDGALGAAEGLLGQPVYLLHELAVQLLRQVQGGDAGLIIRQLLVAVLSQLVLQHLQLFPEDHVLLDLRHPLAHLLLHLELQTHDVHLVGEDVIDQLEPLHRVQLIQYPLPVLMPQGQVLGDEIRQTAGITLIQHLRHHLVGHLGGQLLIGAEDGVGLPQQRLRVRGASVGSILQQLHIGLQKRGGLPQAVQSRPLLTLHQHPHRSLGGLDDLEHMAHRADLVEILLLWLGDADLPLRHQKQTTVALHSVVQRKNGNLPLHVEAYSFAGEGGHAPQRQNGDIDGIHNWSPLLWKRGETNGFASPHDSLGCRGGGIVLRLAVTGAAGPLRALGITGDLRLSGL